MSEMQTAEVAVQLSKKNVGPEVTQKLEKALEDLRPLLGKKKFNDRVKKATKLFTKGLPKKVKNVGSKKKKLAKKPDSKEV